MPRPLFTFLTFLTLLTLVFAQSASALPVTATYSASLSESALSAGQNAAAAIVLDVTPGLHIQSHEPLDPNLIPFNVSIDPNPNLDFLDPIYPAPETAHFPGLGAKRLHRPRHRLYPDSHPLRCRDRTHHTHRQTQLASLQHPSLLRPKNESAVQYPNPDRRGYDSDHSCKPGSLPKLRRQHLLQRRSCRRAPSSSGTVVDFFGRTFTLASGNALSRPPRRPGRWRPLQPHALRPPRRPP